MFLRLIFNDLSAYVKLVLLQIVVPGLLWVSLFFYRFYGPRGYIMGSLGLLLPPIVAPLFLDIKYQSHRLLCSLPVTRSCVVAAKYFSTLIFIFLVGGCYYANVLVLDLAYGGDPILLQQVSNFKVLCAVVYFVVFVISFILPAVFKTGIMGFIITFCCGYVLAMATTMRFYNLNRGDFMAHYTAAERFSDIVPVAGALFMLIVSAVSAVSFFSTKEF